MPDTLKAFWTLATWWRRELKIPVLAITGSVGKTSTKEIAAAILLKWNKGAYSQKSHNNHVGVPYTLCRMSREHRWAVVEMGMNHPGEISVLSRLAEPDVAAITLIAPAHIEGLGSMQAIADAKFEIAEGLKRGGKFILNGDDKWQTDNYEKMKTASRPKALYFGNSERCESRFSEVNAFGFEGLEFVLTLFGEKIPLTMKVIGKHNAVAASCAALAVKSLIPEIETRHIVDGLTSFTAPLMRLATKQLKGGRRLIDDSYNANPASMRALLDIAKDLQKEKMKIALLLGDMRELGAESDKFHQEIGEIAASLKPEFIIAVGPYSKHYVIAAEKQGIKAMDGGTPEAAAQMARKLDFEVLLIKASRGIGLDRAVRVIVERDGI